MKEKIGFESKLIEGSERDLETIITIVEFGVILFSCCGSNLN